MSLKRAKIQISQVRGFGPLLGYHAPEQPGKLCKPQAVLKQIILCKDFLQLILAALSVCCRVVSGSKACNMQLRPHTALLYCLTTNIANVFLDNLTEILRTYSIMPKP